LEEYAREVFPLEEAANGLTWMNEEIEGEVVGGEDAGGEENEEEEEDDDDASEGLVMGGGTGTGTGEVTPARQEESWLA
jgi:hypothetical protein